MADKRMSGGPTVGRLNDGHTADLRQWYTDLVKISEFLSSMAWQTSDVTGSDAGPVEMSLITAAGHTRRASREIVTALGLEKVARQAEARDDQDS